MLKKLYPSMMCADFSNLAEETKKLTQSQIDGFHMDIMDGSFVPNFGLSPEDYQVVTAHTDKLVDAHLMINNPERYVDLFVRLGASRIYFHPEATKHPARVIDQIKQCGADAGIAINPGTSVAMITELLPIVDYVLVMTVNPGFSGQDYLDYVDTKIHQLSELRADKHFEIVVDGAISPDKVKYLCKLGVTGFVLGTSSLFGKQKSYVEIISALKKI